MIGGLWRRFQVLAGTAVFYLTALSVGMSAAADRLAELAPAGTEGAVAWLIRAATWLAAAVLVVRRVTEVPAPLRGLLPVAEQGKVVALHTWEDEHGGTWTYKADPPTGSNSTTTTFGGQPA
jgi:hypothetical protein